MATAVLHASAYEEAKKGTSLVDRFVKYFKENQATIVCALLAMNGAANVYPLYRSLTK